MVKKKHRTSYSVTFICIISVLLGHLLLIAIAGGETYPDMPFDITDTTSIKTFYQDVPDVNAREVVALALIDAPIEVVWQMVVDHQRWGKGSR